MSYDSYEEYLAHPLFLKTVQRARIRAAGACEGCLQLLPTEPHHVKYCKWGDFDPPENIKMLCRPCHEDAHRCRRCLNVALKAADIKAGVNVCARCRC